MASLADAIREKGLANTTITDIVRHARASRTTFYRCFADKEACFLALAERLGAATLIDVQAAVDLHAPWGTQVDQAVDAYLGILSQDPEIVVTFVSDLPLLGRRAAQLRRDAVETYAGFVVYGWNSQRMRDQGIHVTMETAIVLMAGLDELIVRAVQRGDSVLDLAPVAKRIAKRLLAPEG